MNLIDSYFRIQIEELYKAGAPFEVALLVFVLWFSLHVWGAWVIAEKLIKGVRNVFGVKQINN